MKRELAALSLLVVTGTLSFLGILYAVGFFGPSMQVEDTGGREVATSTSIATAPGEGWDALPSEHAVAAAIPRDVPEPPTTSTTMAPVLAPPAAEVRPSPDPAPPVVQGGDSIAEFLRCTRAHESDTAGGYQAVSPSGAHRGAYQFVQSTWDTVARWVGRPDLIGLPPDQASPADQDLLAAELYRREGNRHWGGRC